MIWSKKNSDQAKSDTKKVARDLYSSERIQIQNKAVNDLQQVVDKVDYYFISGGFGLIHENE